MINQLYILAVREIANENGAVSRNYDRQISKPNYRNLCAFGRTYNAAPL